MKKTREQITYPLRAYPLENLHPMGRFTSMQSNATSLWRRCSQRDQVHSVRCIRGSRSTYKNRALQERKVCLQHARSQLVYATVGTKPSAMDSNTPYTKTYITFNYCVLLTFRSLPHDAKKTCPCNYPYFNRSLLSVKLEALVR